jgi:hypothetical protein
MDNKNKIFLNQTKKKRNLPPFDPKIISKLFFEFDERNSRTIKFNKVNEIIEDEKNFYSQPHYSNTINNYRDNLMSQIDYVYSESNKPVSDNNNLESILVNQQVEYSKNMNNSIFETQLKKNSIIIPIMKKRKKINSDNINNALSNNKINQKRIQNDDLNNIVHSQIITLKGKKNKTYKLRNKEISKGIKLINVSPKQIYPKNEEYSKTLDDYEMRFKILNMKKEIFKV